MCNELQVFQTKLPYEGFTPGARGYKKIVYSPGTPVFVIAHRAFYYNIVFLNREQAEVCLKGLVACTQETARRRIPFDTLIAWNFQRAFPRKVLRVKEKT